MIYSLRAFLVTFLVLLQFIAPLVHAHTSEKILSQGVHIPGLEMYARTQSSIPSSNALQCKAVLFCSDIDGQIVGINTGFSRDVAMLILYKKVIADFDYSYLSAQAPPVFKGFVFLIFSTLSILAYPLATQWVRVAHAPRAPPLAA